MKGLTHFISGVAFGTFFPAAVVAAAEAKSFILVLGGVGGILPDTIDFKVARFFETFDLEIDPVELDMDPQRMADLVAGAIDRAATEGRTVKVILHTVRLGADAWRKYSVLFDAEKGQVEITVGPVVSTSRIPYVPSEPPPDRRRGVAKVKTKLVHTYDKANDVTIFSGPDFDFVPRGDHVEIQFLSWHRRWSHSLTLAAALGLAMWGLVALLQALVGFVPAVPAWLYGLVFGGGAAVHVIEDQTGFMGSNLFYPFTKERTEGMRAFHSGHALANFTTFYLAVICIIFNLNRLTPPRPVWEAPWWVFWFWAFVVPMGLVHLAAWWSERRQARAKLKRKKRPDFGDVQDVVDEMDETGSGA